MQHKLNMMVQSAHVYLVAAACGLLLGQVAVRGESEPGPPEAGPFPSAVAFDEYQACGVLALYVGCRMLGRDCSLSEIQRLADPDCDAETSFADLGAAARHFGVNAVPCQLNLEELAELHGPAIIQLRPGPTVGPSFHFAIFAGITRDDKIMVIDPPYPMAYWRRASFLKAWTRNALVLERDHTAGTTVLQNLKDHDSQYWEFWLWTATASGLAGAMGAWWPLLARSMSWRKSKQSGVR